MIRTIVSVLMFNFMLAGASSASAQGVVGELEPTVIEPSPSGLAEAEWRFLKQYGEDRDEDVVEEILPDLENWLTVYPDTKHAPEAQLLKARIHLRLGEYRFAIVDLLKHLREYPGSTSGLSARKLFTETIDKKLNDKIAKTLNEIGEAPDASADKAVRLAAAFGRLAALRGEDFYEPLVLEFRAFLGRFPSYPGRDAMQLELGDLHAKKKEYLAARLAYQKVVRVYPDSHLLAKAKIALGGVLENNLKEYDAAIVVYQDVTSTHPGVEEAWTAHLRIAELAERRKKYALAVDTHEKIIALYPERGAAYDSYVSEARLLREKMSKFSEAVAVLCRLADKYKDEKGVEGLWLAAKIAKKDMKDLETEIRMYDRISAEYPQGRQAPKAMFAAAESYKEAKKFVMAREYYGKISERYPNDSLSSKARKRVDAIINK